MELCQRRFKLDFGKGFFSPGGVWALKRLPRAGQSSWPQGWQSSRSVWTTHSGTWQDFGVVLCRSWTWWSYSMILWFYRMQWSVVLNCSRMVIYLWKKSKEGHTTVWKLFLLVLPLICLMCWCVYEIQADLWCSFVLVKYALIPIYSLLGWYSLHSQVRSKDTRD